MKIQRITFVNPISLDGESVSAIMNDGKKVLIVRNDEGGVEFTTDKKNRYWIPSANIKQFWLVEDVPAVVAPVVVLADPYVPEGVAITNMELMSVAPPAKRGRKAKG